MRLFIGVELQDDVKAAAAAVAERLRERLRRAVRDFHARWIATDNLHITLWFIGEVPDSQAEAIAAALTARSFSVPAFALSIAECGVFPPAGQPRVIWIGVHDGAEEMKSLYAEIANRLAPLGYEPERRAYSPHLTIARVKDAGHGSSRAIRQILAEVPAACGVSHIAAITVFRSRLSPKGATYEPLLRVPLS